MKIVVIGTGYVGLVSGTCFAEIGHRVTCVDIDAMKIKKLRAGEVPIYEPGLDVLVTKNVKSNRLDFSTNLEEVIDGADAAFIAVGTPPGEDGSADLQYVFAAAQQVAEAATGSLVIVDKSTVPVGTGHNIQKIIDRIAPSKNITVASNPEFLREGCAIQDFMKPDRIIVGVDDESAGNVMRAIYKPLTRAGYIYYTTDITSAELIKYAANAFLATKLTFINQMADLCEKVGADIDQVAVGMGLDGRIGRRFLHVGPGYGGSCFPKDTKAIAAIGADHGVGLGLIDKVIELNIERRSLMAAKIEAILGGDVQGKKIAFLGLAFKGDTDDIRESPAIEIINKLAEQGAVITAYDPAAMETAKSEIHQSVSYANSLETCMKASETVVVATEWDQFTNLRHLLEGEGTKRLIDLRNQNDPADFEGSSVDIYCLGKQPRISD